MSTRSEWEEGSSTTKEELKEDDTMSVASEICRMSFEPERYSVDRSIILDRKVIGYKMRTLANL